MAEIEEVHVACAEPDLCHWTHAHVDAPMAASGSYARQTSLLPCRLTCTNSVVSSFKAMLGSFKRFQLSETPAAVTKIRCSIKGENPGLSIIPERVLESEDATVNMHTNVHMYAE